jgi:hypothetical protein
MPAPNVSDPDADPRVANLPHSNRKLSNPQQSWGLKNREPLKAVKIY